MVETVGLVLGTAQLSRAYGVLSEPGVRSIPQQLKLLHHAESMGVVAIDTAPIYGAAEAVIGRSGVTLPVHTKCHPELSVSDSIRISKKALGRETLDTIYLHESLTSAQAIENKIAALIPHLGNDVRAIGASIYELDEFHVALATPEISVIQLPLNLLDRRFGNRELLELAREKGKKVFARSTFLQGVLVADSQKLPPSLSQLGQYLRKFRKVSHETGLSLLCLALTYVRQFHNLSGIIVGVTNQKELDVVVKEFSAPINSASLFLLEQIEAPPWELVDPRNWVR